MGSTRPTTVLRERLDRVRLAFDPFFDLEDSLSKHQHFERSILYEDSTMQQDASSATDEQPSSAAALAAEGASQAPFGPGSPNGRYRDPSQSTPSSTASSDSEDDDPGPDQPRRGDDRNLRIDISNSGPTAPALATPNARLMGSHPWPFTSQTSTFGGSNGEQAGASATAAQTARARAGSVTEWLKQVEAPQFGRRMDDIVPASSMPHEILLQILRSVSATSDLRELSCFQ